MKKIYLITLGLLGLFLFSCNPNKSVYEDLDSQRVPFNRALIYSLVSDDFSTIKDALLANHNSADSTLATDITTLQSFSSTRRVDTLVPFVLAKNFIALDSNSSVNVFYTYSYQQIIPDNRVFEYTDTVTSSNLIVSKLKTDITDAVKNDLVYASYVLAKGGDTNNVYSLFIYDDGTWSVPSNFYMITTEDYDAMNEPFHNFSSQTALAHKMPIFFKQKFPYAEAGDTKQIIFKYYYGGGVSGFIYNYISYDGNNWKWDEQKSSQFIHNGIEWKFDPTVNYTLIGEDYQAIVDWVAANDTISNYLGYDAKREWYFGTNAKYSDFNMHLSERQDTASDPNHYLTDLSEDDATAVIYERLKQAVQIALEFRFPDAQPYSNGLPVYYVVTYLVWTPGAMYTYNVKFLCTEVGKFEYVEGPTLL